ncbi:hypothetical protein K466DRAFT_585296 [Polyporus arcularius HHB13444]|uniref:Transmembrane protein n=1 Tax=Polyporus arcularius HHB13444 TaxID=1314778 RepID=A0A5C3PRG2_9APHY|nr:hypothetical protein K466DRAFT_585296 [Polyporus arcularius HHB13444]
MSAYGYAMSFEWLKGPLGAIELGLVFAAMTFGVVATKAISYLCGKTHGGALVKTTLASMLSLNVLQIMLTIHGAYTSLVIFFGRTDDLTTDTSLWSITLQVLFTTLTASIAHTFFAIRLHAVIRSLYLTIIIIFFAVVELAMSIYTVKLLFEWGPGATITEASGDIWPMIVVFTISAILNLVIAIAGYVRMQRPYVLQKHGRTTFVSELKYWTVKSLFFCSLVSILGAVTFSSMMIWVAASCVQGNLYTLSVLLNSDSREVLANPIASGNNLSDRALSPPFTDHTAVGEDIVKSQA